VRRQRSILLLAICALAAIILFRIYEDFYDSKALEALERNNRAARSTERLIATVLDAETGQRGYLLTSSPTYLLPFQEAVRSLPTVLTEFRSATAMLAIDPQREELIQQLASTKMSELEITVKLKQNHDDEGALRIVRAGNGNQLMERLRQVGRELQNGYQANAAEERRSAKRRGQLTLILTVCGSILAGAILLVAARRLNKSSQEQALLFGQIAERERQYQLLADRLQAVREEERAHLAREIHDVLGQSLTGIKLDLSVVNRRLEKGDTATAIQKLKQGSAAVDDSIRLLRRIATELRPPLLDYVGLAAAIQAYANDFGQRTGLELELDIQSDRIPLTADQRIALYRIFQESITNIVRHAGTNKAVVSLWFEAGRLSLKIEDKGKGFDMQSSKTSLGLLGMQERARLIGAGFSIASQPGRGTSICVTMDCGDNA
jgi:signal transduction histidine kinase